MALQHLRSSTASKRPDPAAMVDGQLAVNTNAASTGLFFKDSGGNLIKVGPVHVGTTAPNATPASGGHAGNSIGEQWLDTTGGGYVLKIWDGSAWQSEAGDVTITDKIIHGGDTDTAIRFPAADTVSVETAGTEICRITNTDGLSIGTFSANPGVDNTNVGIQLRTNGSFRASAGTFHSLNRNAVSRSNQPILEYRLQGSLVGTIRDYNSGDGIGFVADGTEKLYLEGDQVRSETIYAATSVSAANIFINSTGRMLRSTSSIKYKTDVETLQDQYADTFIENARPVWFRSKCKADDPAWGHYGLIAEEIIEVDPRLAMLEPDENGSYLAADGRRFEPEGVQYERVIPHLINLIQRQRTAIAALEGRVAALEAS